MKKCGDPRSASPVPNFIGGAGDLVAGAISDLVLDWPRTGNSKERKTTVQSVLAAVRVAPGKTEIREFPMPDIPPDCALLKMEVAGICGTDVKLYREPPSSAPVIMGHENIGYIARTGRDFTKRQGFKEGDLVFLEHYVCLLYTSPSPRD